MKEIIELLNQYADDMDVFSIYNQQSLDAIFDTINNFYYHTGFTVNYDKTKIYRMGSLRSSDAKLFTQNSVAWTSDPINILGIWVSNNYDEIIQKNYQPVLEKIKIILNSWKSRSLTFNWQDLTCQYTHRLSNRI